MRYLKSILSVLLVCLFCYAESAEFHAILLIDSEAENIETAMVKNHSRWRRQLDKISQYTGMEVHEHAFVGKDLRTSDVFPFIQSLSTQPDDIILFYFCGHGYRTRHKDNQWPYLCWAHENIAVDFKLMTDLLMKKQSRLLFAMAECCNNFIESQEDVVVEEYVPLHVDIIRSNYEKLFLETTGTIIASSSLPGEFSWAWVHRGSCFTLAFLDAIDQEVRQVGGTEWAIIFEVAGKKVGDLQSPQYVIME
ncbi:MAG: hypothetical protein K940chlam3_00973 [Chlamydiae bacterium]|nr:hypothetical protein [Chlamydiota bacterium]